jgi:hypothetical protein
VRERRKKEGYKLRIYIDAIKDARATTESQWMEDWARNDCKDHYITKSMWISYLEECALQEAKVFFRLEAS